MYRLTLYICIVICVVQNMAEKLQNLLGTQKVDGDEGSLNGFFRRIFLNCAKSDYRFLLTFLFCFGNNVLIEFIQ